MSVRPHTITVQLFLVVSVLCASVSAETVIRKGLSTHMDKGLVLYYSFDEDGGETVLDLSASKNDGKVYGAKHISDGKIGGAYVFDGRSSHINCGNNASLRITKDLTIAAWFYLENVDHKNTLISKHHAAEFDLIFGVGGHLAYYQANDCYGFSYIFEPQKWYHIVLTRKAKKKTVTLYVNGTQVKDKWRYRKHPPATGHNVGIGYRLTRKQLGFKGMIDEVMIYNRAFSYTQVKSLYRLYNAE